MGPGCQGDKVGGLPRKVCLKQWGTGSGVTEGNGETVRV